jgi:hypothetical protein
MNETGIKGYEGYYTINSDGVIRNVHGKALSVHKRPDGYMQVGLTRDGKRKSYLTHRLIAEAFVSNDEGLTEVNHMNGDKADNRIENLEWCSRAQNTKHAYDTGLRKVGKGNIKGHKLVESDVSLMKALFKAGSGNQLLATLFGIHSNTVSNIRNNHKWAHVS